MGHVCSDLHFARRRSPHSQAQHSTKQGRWRAPGTGVASCFPPCWTDFGPLLFHFHTFAALVEHSVRRASFANDVNTLGSLKLWQKTSMHIYDIAQGGLLRVRLRHSTIQLCKEQFALAPPATKLSCLPTCCTAVAEVPFCTPALASAPHCVDCPQPPPNHPWLPLNAAA